MSACSLDSFSIKINLLTIIDKMEIVKSNYRLTSQNHIYVDLNYCQLIIIDSLRIEMNLSIIIEIMKLVKSDYTWNLQRKYSFLDDIR